MQFLYYEKTSIMFVFIFNPQLHPSLQIPVYLQKNKQRQGDDVNN
jgi:hypothetical protein